MGARTDLCGTPFFMAGLASIYNLALLQIAKDAPIFYSGRCNSSTYPDLALLYTELLRANSVIAQSKLYIMRYQGVLHGGTINQLLNQFQEMQRYCDPVDIFYFCFF